MLAGRLTPSEYDDRVGQALAAKTESDLTPLLADMPVLKPRWQKPVLIIVACLVLAALIGGLAWNLTSRGHSVPQPETTSTTVAPPPVPTQTASTTAPTPTTTTTIVPPESTVTVTAPPPTTVTVTAEPTSTNDCPFTRPLSPAQLAQAGAACAMGQDAYCHCVP